MRKHFVLTCLAYLFLGIGFVVEMMGIKAGMSMTTTLIITETSIVFFAIIVVTSMQKVKDVIFKKDENKNSNP